MLGSSLFLTQLRPAVPFRPRHSHLHSLHRALSSTVIKPFKFDREKCLQTTISPMKSSPAKLLELPMVYARLCKAKLSGLVVCTTLAGYMIVPGVSFNIADPVMWSTMVGTALCAGAANAWNQWAESAHDARMMRTRMRPLPSNQISPYHAFGWASACATTGLSMLYIWSGPIACSLAAATIGLYTLVYTPMKRHSVLNTWVGAVVGGIPPLIGYAGALTSVGTAMTGWTALFPDALLLGAVLYCWQFPHFNALSHNLRQDYNRAGYCMAAIHRPALNRSSALFHAAALVPLAVAFSPLGTGMTSWWILLDGGMLGAWMTVLATMFYKMPGKGTARKLFLGSLLYLPLFLTFLVIHRI